MNNSGVIQTSQSADLVTHKVLVGGEELPGIYQVKHLLVQKEMNRVPTAVITLIDGEPATRDFPLSNEGLLVPGTEIAISAGYHSDEETIFEGIVIKHSLKIRESSSLLIVECKDKAVKMTIGRKSRYYYDSTDSDIIEEVLSNYDLDPQIEATDNTHPELIQYNTSDWDFMMLRAQANGMLCIVDDGAVNIAKPVLEGTEVETVTFGATLLDFDAEIDARNQIGKVSGYAWSYADQEVVAIEAEDPGASGTGNLSLESLSEVIGLEDLELRHGGAVTDVELQQWADAKWLFQQMSKVRGRAKFQGIPAVRPGKLLKLEGVGERFSGTVYVTGVRHEISEGNWTVDAQFGLDPRWFSETYDINPQPASGLLAGVCGLQVGVVTQLQEDPDGEDRILVRLPIVSAEEQGVWCRVASLDAGENRGAFFRPELGDEVIAGFINDDPTDAVILGMLNSSAKPAPVVASDDNHEKGFVTRSEMKLMFDDDKRSITVETPAGKKIVLDEDAGSILMEDENGNTVTMDDSGIVIESGSDLKLIASGDVTIEGTNIQATANAEFKAEGSAGVEMSSSATATLKGSLVQIN